MRYVFFGGQESPFATIILDKITKAGMAPIASIRDAKAPLDLDYLKSLNADFFLVAAFGKILKKDLLDIPPKGVIGVHPSLLPKYRGASPVQSVILDDEKETGTTLFLIDEKVDHGRIVESEKLKVESRDDYTSLEEKLAKLSVKLILEAIPKWLSGELKPQIQNETEATYTKKFVTENAEVNFKNDNPEEIWLKIRALNPEPGAYAVLKLKSDEKLRLKLLEADFIDGKLNLKIVQPEAKKPMRYKDFLNGYGKNLSEVDLKSIL